MERGVTRHENTPKALARLVPEGPDVYDVGGEQLDVALARMKDFGIVTSSGMVSVYGDRPEKKCGIRTGMEIFLRRLSIYDFICSDTFA